MEHCDHWKNCKISKIVPEKIVSTQQMLFVMEFSKLHTMSTSWNCRWGARRGSEDPRQQAKCGVFPEVSLQICLSQMKHRSHKPHPFHSPAGLCLTLEKPNHRNYHQNQRCQWHWEGSAFFSLLAFTMRSSWINFDFYSVIHQVLPECLLCPLLHQVFSGCLTLTNSTNYRNYE